jgi:hypothetical protein
MEGLLSVERPWEDSKVMRIFSAVERGLDDEKSGLWGEPMSAALHN